MKKRSLKYYVIALNCLLAFVTLLVACRRQAVSVAPPTRSRQKSADKSGSPPPADVTSNDDRTPVALPALQSRLIRNRNSTHDKVLNPESDGWKSEAFGATAQQVCDQVATIAFLGQAQEPQARQQLGGLLSDNFVCSALRPTERETMIVDSGRFLVKRAVAGWPSESTVRFQQVSGAVEAMSQLAVLADTELASGRVATKTVRVASTKSGARTLHVVEAFGATADGFVEQHCKWTCDWTMDPASQQPRLSSLVTSDYEETFSRNRLFSDDTSSVLADSSTYTNQLRHGLGHWLDRIETTHGMYIFAEYGIAIGDVNGDGWEDIYVCQPGGLPNRLLVQSSDGTLVDRSRAARVDWLDHTSSALLLDFDNDGDQDLALALESQKIVFMQNSGEGVFSIATEVPIADRHVQGLSAADYDNDGLLDVYLTVGFADTRARSSEARPAFVYHNANEGGANVLLRNRCSASRWQFSDVTSEVGLDQNNRRHSLAAAWEDFDNDGDQDLYVANDYGQNCLYENTNGSFRDIAAAAGVVDFGSGMSVSWSDYDHDGWMDLYVGNMFSSAGNRITRQAAFQRQVAPEDRAILSRFAKGNSLFRNRGNRRFDDVGKNAGIELGRWAWSSLFCDINNDGHEDVFVANGYISNDDEDDL